MLKLSLCITTYNRCDLTLQSFAKVINDDRITEIVIVDDCSEEDIYNRLSDSMHGKCRLIRNESNIGMMANKLQSVKLASNDWCIILDSDNQIDSSYIDAIEELHLNEKTIYCPEFAKPHFDYREFSGAMISANNVGKYMANKSFGALFNTCNYVVNRKRYIDTYQSNDEIKGTDTIWHAYNHLKAGGNFYVVPDMQYEHLVHNGSEFIKHIPYNMGMATKIENKIKSLYESIK